MKALVAASTLLFAALALAQTPSKPAAATAGLGKAQAASNEETNIRAYIELLHRNVKKSKSQIMGDIMQLDTEQAAKFWPIYQQFESDYSTLGEKVVALIRDYADSYDAMTDTAADKIANQVLAIEQERNELKKRYYERLKGELGAITATRFLQVENQLERLIDLQIAAQLPVVSQR